MRAAISWTRAMHCPVLMPGAGAPVIWADVKLLKRLATLGPASIATSATPDSSIISPALLRT